jgi:hypothetical protein
MLQMKYVPSMIASSSVYFFVWFTPDHQLPSSMPLPGVLVTGGVTTIADRLRHGRRPLTLRTRFELGNVVAWMMVWDAVMLALAALVPA